MAREIPPALRRFAERNAPSVSEDAGRVVIEQAGEMRLDPAGRWHRFTAEQWMAIDEIAFCWHARVRMAPLVTAVVEDAYEGDHGRLDVKLWGALRLAHEEGPELDRGETQRYLAELPWNPAAILRNPALRFEARGEAVRVWAADPQTYVDLFLEDGDVVRTYTETRVRGDHGAAPWEGRFTRYEERGGLRVPTEGEVAWQLPEGRFTYWRGSLSGLDVV